MREYSGHPRINESYRRGFAPESVVHIGRYFPDLEYQSVDGSGFIRPAESGGDLTMLWFWDPGSSESIRQMKDLASICEEYSPQGFRLITIALDDDIGKISRFHQHNQMNWAAAAEPLSASAVQVLGITRGPHIIMLDENNRILVREDEFPGKNELRDLIETRFDRQQEM